MIPLELTSRWGHDSAQNGTKKWQRLPELPPWNVTLASELREPAFAARDKLTGTDVRAMARALLAMRVTEFQQQFRGFPMKRAKRRGLGRNTAVVLGNVARADDAPGALAWRHTMNVCGNDGAAEFHEGRPASQARTSHFSGSAIVRMHDPERDGLVAEAMGLVDNAYSFTRAARIDARTLLGLPYRSRRARFALNSVIAGCVCPDVIEKAYNDALGLAAAPDTRRLVPPAAFYENFDRKRCPVTWCQLPTTH